MAKINDKKLNNGCIKIFKFLILLYQDIAYYKSVVNIFSEGEYLTKKEAKLIQVFLNKCINAMRVFGIKIIKKNNKYELESSLYSIKYTPEDLKSISLLLNAAESFPDSDISQNFNSLASNLLLRMNNTDKSTLNMYKTNYDITFFYTDLKSQIEACRKYCKEKQVLQIIYLKNGQEVKTKCNPVELIYDYKTTYFKVYDIIKKENLEIALPNILSVVIQPQITSAHAQTTTVVYKLKDRLAKTYKLKENEYMHHKEEDAIYIVNKDEPMDKLFSRLMRYSYSCEVISPKFLRNQMLNLIDETMNLYK